MAIQLQNISIGKGESIIVKIDGSVETSLSIVVDVNGNCLIQGPVNVNSTEWLFSIKGWERYNPSIINRPSRIQLPGMVRVYDRDGELAETDVTDAMCRAGESTAARYCIRCKQVIYIDSRSNEDKYRVNASNFYEHDSCPILFDYPPSPVPALIPPFGRSFIE